jgi:hypothetical protein
MKKVGSHPMQMNKHLKEAESALHRVYRYGGGLTKSEHKEKRLDDAIKAILEYLKEVDQEAK